MGEYPEELERPGLLRDGRSIYIRPATTEDAEVVLAFNGRLSRRTVAMRSLGPTITMTREAAERYVDTDFDDRLVLLATLDESVIGLADYARSAAEPDRAEIAFTVEDAYQGLGLGGLLLEHLAAAARARGVEVFEAEVLDENLAMIRTFQSSGYRVEFGEPGSTQHIELAVDPRRQVLARSDRRERSAVQSSLHPIFAPRSVAVVGASREERNVGNSILRNLHHGGFTGVLHAVNPHTDEIDGVATVGSVRDLTELDLAIIAVPAAAVPEVLRDCGERNVGAVVIVSTEMTSGGTLNRNEILRMVRGHGMRMVGPNCMGVISKRGKTDLVATFSPAIPAAGRVSMATQSGPLGLAILDHARQLGLGFCGFVSLGDSLDVSPNDLLQWWETDRSTGVVLLHLDAFGNPRRFARVARRLAVRKPVIAVHPGSLRTLPVGTLPYAGPTASDATLNALFAQTGVIRTRSMQEMFDTALAVAHQPVPPGPRVAILTNAEGPGALTAGACRAVGLVLADLGDATIDAVGRAGGDAMTNPLDLTPNATAEDYRTALTALLGDPGVDSVIVLYIPPLVLESRQIARAIVDAAQAFPNKPVLASYLSREGVIDDLRLSNDRAIPSYRFPEAAAVALGNAAGYGNWLRLPGGVSRVPADIFPDRAREYVEASGPGEVRQEEAVALLASFGIETGTLESGQDMTLRVLDDPIFGPVMALGPADRYAQVYGDISYRITPLTDRDAEDMVHSLRGYAILAGMGDRPSIDIDALVDALLRVSAMVDSIPELVSLSVGLTCAYAPGTGVAASDVEITLASPSAGRLAREATVEPM